MATSLSTQCSTLVSSRGSACISRAAIRSDRLVSAWPCLDTACPASSSARSSAGGADRWGRAWLLPIGLGLSAIAGTFLLLGFPLALAPIVAMVLSLGYDMTQPLLAGIVTSLSGQRPGQAMGLNVFTLFVGFGLGSLIFGEVLRFGFGPALGLFTAIEAVLMAASVALFRSELPATAGKPQVVR